jgi:hypothetical protein
MRPAEDELAGKVKTGQGLELSGGDRQDRVASVGQGMGGRQESQVARRSVGDRFEVVVHAVESFVEDLAGAGHHPVPGDDVVGIEAAFADYVTEPRLNGTLVASVGVICLLVE